MLEVRRDEKPPFEETGGADHAAYIEPKKVPEIDIAVWGIRRRGGGLGFEGGGVLLILLYGS